MRRPRIAAALLGLLLALLAEPALAQSDVAIRAVRTAGNGCPRGSVDVVMAGSQAAVLFSRYNLENASSTAFTTRNCTVGIQLSVPEGVTLSVATVEWRGVVALEQGSIGQFARALLFGGLPRINVNRPFSSPGVQPFSFRDQVQGAMVSGCRTRDVMLLATTILGLRGTGTASVDSADIGAPAMRIQFQRGTCQPQTRPPAPRPAG
jgi:hypothetical protein